MTTQPIDSVLEDIIKKATAVGLSRWALAAFCDLHKNTLRNMDLKTWGPSVETIRRIQERLQGPVPALRAQAKERGIPLKEKPVKRKAPKKRAPRSRKIAPPTTTEVTDSAIGSP